MGEIIRMASQAERLGIVETKVQHIDEKIDDLKVDVKDMHDCLDRTRDGLNERLDQMIEEYRANRDRFYEHANNLHKAEKAEHAELAAKIDSLEKFKSKWTYLALGGVAVMGWVSGHIDQIAAVLK